METMESSDVMRNLVVEEVETVLQDCNLIEAREYDHEVENSISDACSLKNDSLCAVSTPVITENIGDHRSPKSRQCEEATNKIEDCISAICDNTFVREDNIITEVVVCASDMSKNSDNSEEIVTSNSAVAPAQMKNLTFSEDGENDKTMHEQKTLEIKPKSVSGGTRNNAFHVAWADLVEEELEHCEHATKKIKYEGTIPFGNDKSIFDSVTKIDTKTKNSCSHSNIICQNFAVLNSNTKIWDSSGNFCSQELQASQICHQQDQSDGSTTGIDQQETEMDLLRPASVTSTSDNSYSSTNLSDEPERKKRSKKENTVETDPAILSRRQKQIEYGKNTAGYRRYKKLIPKDRRTCQHPTTPPKSVKYSRRAWDGLVKTWRRKLHNWDPPKREALDDKHSSHMSSSSSILSLSDDSENVMEVESEPTMNNFLLEKKEINGS